MTEPETNKRNWTEIIVTALLTGLVTIIAAIVVFNYTTDTVELTYEEFPISLFENGRQNVGIANYSIKNLGKKPATNVTFLIYLENKGVIDQPVIETSNELTEYKLTRIDSNRVRYVIKELHQFESCNFSFLLKNFPPSTQPKVELRSKEQLGNKAIDSDETVSPGLIYGLIIIAIVALLAFVFLIVVIRKSIEQTRELNHYVSLEEERKTKLVKDVISQGVTYCDAGLISEAISVLKNGKYLYADDPSIHSNLARAYAWNKDFDLAETEFKVAEKLLANDVDRLIYYYTKAHFYALKKDKKSMYASLRRAQSYHREKVIEKMRVDDEFIPYREDEEFQRMSENK